MSDNIKKSIRNWLQIQPAQPYAIQIQEIMDFELSAIRNRIWYRGDSNELEQMYQQSPEYADKYKFWASKCTPGMEMRKIHTGLPALIIKVLTTIVLGDMNEFEFTDDIQKELWEKIEEKNHFRKKLEKVLKEVLYIGDGAWKLTFNTKRSEYPILHWYPGDRIELKYEGDDLNEIIFKTPYEESGKQYVLLEHYGYGYVKNELYESEKLIDFKTFSKTKHLADYTFDETIMLAKSLQVYESVKFEGRGGSIFEGKLDSFDAFDEAWSQWMDALRAGRAKTYVPESYVPKNPETGEMLKPNPFDNRFIAGDDNMSENGKNVIQTEQPNIPHDSYAASYCTALDLCLQGIISPSTLGIDVKKLDNADAQREKEKATLYTRNAIVETLQEELPELINICINAHNILNKKAVQKVEVDVPFGEYANPSFESQVETVGKGKTQGIMSIEACVDELYGDSKDDQWKQEEVARLKAEQGIAAVTEPAINTDGLNVEGIPKEEGMTDEGQSSKQDVSDEQNGI